MSKVLTSKVTWVFSITALCVESQKYLPHKSFLRYFHSWWTSVIENFLSFPTIFRHVYQLCPFFRAARLSARLSNAWIVTKRKKNLFRFLYHTKYEKKNGWRGTTPSTWNFGWNWLRWSKIADFQSIFARSACPQSVMIQKMNVDGRSGELEATHR